MKKIVLTGGGTAGHVTPNMALIPELLKLGYEVHYIGSKNGMEKDLIEGMNIPYYGISTGKLRRYFDLKNFTDPFRILHGFSEAKSLLKKINPDVVFSKGGYVSVPVVYAAHSRKIPAIIHESDMSSGLANRLCIPYAAKICANFPEALATLPEGKSVLTGTPIRKELFEGNKRAGLTFCKLDDSKPVILVMGGSLGAAAVNKAVREALPQLLEKYQVIHLCGKGKLDTSLIGTDGYVQFEYISDELKDLFAAADIVISRAGANAICELVALKKPNILIPLPAAGTSRGDQILNAASFEKQGFSLVLDENKLSSSVLLEAVEKISAEKQTYIDNMAKSSQSDSVNIILGLINEAAGK